MRGISSSEIAPEFQAVPLSGLMAFDTCFSICNLFFRGISSSEVGSSATGAINMKTRFPEHEGRREIEQLRFHLSELARRLQARFEVMFRLLLKRMNAIPTPKLIKIYYGVMITDISLNAVDYAYGEDLYDTLNL
ncbi:hypothetical protein RHGRI_035955 [Rhododendron griersonianum]|uniref:Uncharacterized protein n=1 Tax=Rhododendron griersonianum TaxID=479676 RepID=A0AAV6HP41_9ERIC|nr:hypothetical protein RHGRI_035955 [Rhododendron griersonianum]KAG5514736.1 hypothetical protein RHGRI_035955 [Rhododendron griersonianum]